MAGTPRQGARGTRPQRYVCVCMCVCVCARARLCALTCIYARAQATMRYAHAEPSTEPRYASFGAACMVMFVTCMLRYVYVTQVWTWSCLKRRRRRGASQHMRTRTHSPLQRPLRPRRVTLPRANAHCMTGCCSARSVVVSTRCSNTLASSWRPAAARCPHTEVCHSAVTERLLLRRQRSVWAAAALCVGTDGHRIQEGGHVWLAEQNVAHAGAGMCTGAAAKWLA